MKTRTKQTKLKQTNTETIPPPLCFSSYFLPLPHLFIHLGDIGGLYVSYSALLYPISFNNKCSLQCVTGLVQDLLWESISFCIRSQVKEKI